MPPSRRPGQASKPTLAWHRRITLVALSGAFLALAAGCASQPGHPQSGGSPASCGTTRTAANVPVTIEVMKGSVPCGTALAVERAYTRAIVRAIRSHKFGNGTGPPIPVQGWTCQGFPTPTADQTGQTSKCVSGTTEIVALIQLPASSG